MGDIFDQIASGQKQTPSAVPSAPAPQGDIFDQLAAGSNNIQPASLPGAATSTIKPESSMVDQVLGALAPQNVPKTKGAGLKQGDEGEAYLASGDQDKANFMSSAGGAALLTLLGANYGPGALAAVKAAAESHPLVAKILMHGLGDVATLKVAKYLHVFDGK